MRYVLRGLILLVTAAAIAFTYSMIRSGHTYRANIGFLVIGGLLTALVAFAIETERRWTQARDLARALYVELADRVARCCFDCEAPWAAYLDASRARAENMDSFRLRKFAPAEPIIYPAIASQIAMLKKDVPTAIIQFYYQLAAWHRDVQNAAMTADGLYGGTVLRDVLGLLAERLHQTLGPGLRALNSLAPYVHKPEEIDAAAIALYDVNRTWKRDGQLKERIQALL